MQAKKKEWLFQKHMCVHFYWLAHEKLLQAKQVAKKRKGKNSTAKLATQLLCSYYSIISVNKTFFVGKA